MHEEHSNVLQRMSAVAPYSSSVYYFANVCTVLQYHIILPSISTDL